MFREVSWRLRYCHILTTCSDDGKNPIMILKGLEESYKNHVGFGIDLSQQVGGFWHAVERFRGRYRMSIQARSRLLHCSPGAESS